jgi:nucleotide-binding universal stress UspA family protein
MFRHLLIPIDGSPLAAHGAKVGLRLAKALGARVTLLHVAFAYAPLLRGRSAYVPVSRLELKKHAAKLAQDALGPLVATAHKRRVRCSTHTTLGGEPWNAILRAARAARCDVIVMASHGRSGLSGLLLGSETTQVLARSRIPVLVVR